MNKRFYPFFLGAFMFLALGLRAQSSTILINEFMAKNTVTLADEDGDFSDWIELYNPGETSVNLNGYYLTDKADNLTKWDIPNVNLAPDSYLVIFASDKKRDKAGSELHTNFNLSASGEFLALVEPDGVTIVHSYGASYPPQEDDISYGLYQGLPAFFDKPTPGAENIVGDLVQAVVFSAKRGFYNTPIEVSLTGIGDVQIYYTTDGSRPTKEKGTLYTTPIRVATTTPLSAIAVNGSGVYSPIVTQSYIYISDVVQQAKQPVGYPSDWKMDISSTTIKPDYEMDPEVCQSAEYKDQMESALKAIPTMSLVTNKEFLFSSKNDAINGGIYIYTGRPNGTGKDWVRPTSAEFIDPKTGKEFQINCRLKLHGGNSRNPSNSLKHGFELKFTSGYGPTKLNYDLFEEEGATSEFNSLVLRGGYNYTWAKVNSLEQRTNAQYLQDSWTKTTQLEMGHLSGHERFVHLYINGLYWGLYNVCEEYTNDFAESYLEGQEDDFDIIKETQEVASGSIDAFNALVAQMTSKLSNNVDYQKIQGRNADGSLNASYQNLIDLDNYMDYMLINYYLGNRDWNKNNWAMVRNWKTNKEGFRFLCWDAETTMTSPTENIVALDMDAKNPAWFLQFLIGNKDFKVRFADRVKKHMQDAGGALTGAAAAERYRILAEEIDLPIIGESARWGDGNIDNQLMTRNDHWIPRQNDLYDNYFPVRTGIVIQQLINKGFLNDLEAPLFSHESGEWNSEIMLGMTSNKGEIYYTTDGSDPRELVTSAVSNRATLYTGFLPLSQEVTITARTKSGDEWSAMEVGHYTFSTTTAVNDLEKIGITATNYPNPFTDFTTIAYDLKKKSQVDIDVYTLDGRLAERIFSGTQAAGGHSLEFTPKTDLNGLFIYRIKAGDDVFVGKMMRGR